MKRLLFTMTGLSAAFYLVACSSSEPGVNQNQGGPSGGNTGTESFGTGANGGQNGTGSNGGGPVGAGGGSFVGAGGGGVGAAPGAGGGAGAAPGAGGGTMGAGGGGGGAPVVVNKPELVTSGVDNFWQEGTLGSGAGQTSITINTGVEGQTWLGFGGTFNEAGWEVLGLLTPAEREAAIKWLFSAAEGANLKWGRIPIGASDYALERYTLNESDDDFDMSDFSIARDEMHLIPYIKAALAVKGDITFWGSPWTPPTWMKTVEEFNGSDLKPDSSNEATAYHSRMKDDMQTLQAHALYFARWVQAYENNGISINHVQPQNEPGYDTRYPSCLWDAGLLGTFVGQYLGPTFESEGVTADIWFGTLSNSSTYDGHINGLTGAAAGYVTGVGLQWNTIDAVSTLANQGYLVMNTEHKCGNYPWLNQTAQGPADANRDSFLPGMAPNNHAYGEETWDEIKKWVEAGVHIYNAWNMALDTAGQNLDEERPWPQNALLVVDRNAKTIRRTAAYWVFRHLSYYVDPGAVRLTTTGGNALAFRNPDNTIVAIVHNRDGSPASTSLTAGERTVQFDVPARGWASVNLK